MDVLGLGSPDVDSDTEADSLELIGGGSFAGDLLIMVVLLLLVNTECVVVVREPGFMYGREWHFSSSSFAMGDRFAGMSSVDSLSDSSLTSGVAGRTDDSRGRGRARVGPFFFGRTASLCFAAEWLSFDAGESAPFSS